LVVSVVSVTVSRASGQMIIQHRHQASGGGGKEVQEDSHTQRGQGSNMERERCGQASKPLAVRVKVTRRSCSVQINFLAELQNDCLRTRLPPLPFPNVASRGCSTNILKHHFCMDTSPEGHTPKNATRACISRHTPPVPHRPQARKAKEILRPSVQI